MSITDELREWVRDGKGSLLAIADRIDAEHEAKVSYWQDASYKDGYDEGFASADDWLGQHEDAMAEHGWVRLPVDADGEVIHIGDKVTCARSVWEVTGFRITGLAWGVCCTIFNDHGGSGTNVYPPCDLRHYHEPTVEDVLFEFAQFWSDEELTDIEHLQPRAAQTIAEYAAKLRLAGDGE